MTSRKGPDVPDLTKSLLPDPERGEQLRAYFARVEAAAVKGAGIAQLSDENTTFWPARHQAADWPSRHSARRSTSPGALAEAWRDRLLTELCDNLLSRRWHLLVCDDDEAWPTLKPLADPGILTHRCACISVRRGRLYGNPGPLDVRPVPAGFPRFDRLTLSPGPPPVAPVATAAEPDGPLKPKRHGGKDFRAQRAVLARELREHIRATGEAKTKAAYAFVDRVPGDGTRESRMKELVKTYNELFGTEPPESPERQP